jgi:uncharacterized protein YjbI with pentapeptide repeats
VTFTGSRFQETDFIKASITSSNFNQTTLKGKGVRFKNASLYDTNFCESKIYGVSFSECKKLQNIDWSNATIERVNFENSVFKKCDFSNAEFYGTNFQEASFIESVFAHSKIKTGFCGHKIFLYIIPLSLFMLRLPGVLFSVIDFILLLIFSLAFARSKTSFYRAKFQDTSFCGARIESASFREATCEQIDFTYIQTAIHYKWARWLVFIYFYCLVTFLNIVITIFISYATFLLLSNLRFSQAEQQANLFTCIILIWLSFGYFLTTSLLKNIGEAILVIPIIILAIVLVTFNQPVLSGIVWTVAIFAVLRIFNILANLNFWIPIIIGFSVSILGLSVLFNYQTIIDSEFFEYISMTMILSILVCTWFTASLAELKFFATTARAVSIIFYANIFLVSTFIVSIILWLYRYFLSKERNEYDLYLAIIWFGIAFGIALGIYLGWQVSRDRQNYRLLRDRGVFFCHLFKPFITEFQGANLIAANFSFARLQNANFQTADLTHACWYGATKLETCRFGKSYLRYPSIRKLLAKPTPTGLQRPKSRRARRVIQRYHRLPKSIKKFIRAVIFDPKLKNFDYLDLQGIRLSHWNIPDNLADGLRALPKGLHFHRSSLQFWICFPTNGLAAWLYPLEFWRSSLTYNLANTSFAGSNLCHADLRGANLTKVNLVGSQLHGTDLRDTNLTGIYIQDVQLSSKTRLEGAFCEWLYLEKPQTISTEPVSVSLKGKALDNWVFEGLFMGAKDVAEIADIRNNIANIKNEFATIDSIRNRVNREYRLNRFANEAAENYQIDADLYRQMFEHYKHERRQMERQQYWWQYILWFKIEPGIERANQWTQELDIFPLLENLGRLSILVAVVTFANNILKPNVNPEILYRSGRIVHPDSERIPGIKQLALEQLRQKQGSLVGINAEGMNLEGINLRAANLRDANFQNATLTEADLSQATLVGANLAGADLEDAQLGFSFTLGNETLENSLRISLPLPEPLKKGANLEGANLKGANLKGANLKGTNLEGADLSGIIASDADLQKADLETVDLTIYADLTNANLTGADLTNANLEGAIFCNTTMPDGTVRNDGCPS